MSARRPYVRPMPRTWWRADAYFVRYMLREATSLAVLGEVLVLLAGLVALRRGPEAFAAFVAGLGSPPALGFHALALLAIGYHAMTFLAMMPRTVRIEQGGRAVPARRLVAVEYAVLAAVSLAVLAAFALA